LTNWFEAEFILLKVFRLQPSELDRLEFYRAEILMENLKKHNEEEEGVRKKEEEKYSMSSNNPTSDASKLMRDAQTKMPNFNAPSIPNFNIPNFKF
jgi:hypothetical protein